MKKFKFSILLFIVTVCTVICCAFTGCLSTADYEEIYENDAKIISGASYSRVGSIQSGSVSPYGGSYKLSCKKFSGVCQIRNNFTVTKDTAAKLSLEVTDGKIKVVLVNSDTVYKLAEGEFNYSLNFNDIPYGNYTLKIVGVSAQFNLTLEYEF